MGGISVTAIVEVKSKLHLKNGPLNKLMMRAATHQGIV